MNSVSDGNWEVTSELRKAFAQFRDDLAESTRVLIRRQRAAELRSLLANPETIDLATFNQEVWVFESSARLNGRDVKGQLFPDQTLDESLCHELQEALQSNDFEMHGNFTWGSGTRVYGSMLRSLSSDEKLERIREALRNLNDDKLPPLEKARKLHAVPGFGNNSATGLVMVYHPSQFAIWNKQSKEAISKLGYQAADLTTFQSLMAHLRDSLEAEDFLELDWFLYKINQSAIDPYPQEQQHWLISLGEGSRLWPECQSAGIAVIGWNSVGDLNQYKTKEELEAAIRGEGDASQTPSNDSRACLEFRDTMQKGDYIYVKKGRNTICGIGRVESNYRYDPSRSEYRNVRDVEWLATGSWPTPEGLNLPLKTLTEVSRNQALVNFAKRILKDGPIVKQPPIPTPYIITEAISSLFMAEQTLEGILSALIRKKNLILQGPPGCGKTFIAKRLAYLRIGVKDPTKVAMVQFHQSYSYEDFIQGWRPRESGGFELRNGVFYEFCQRATDDPASEYVFLIDEINRGNLSKIFGELLMLIESDKRGPDFAIPLTYSHGLDDTFYIPENVHLIGTMNTADRSLAMVDYALRRRFTFVDLRPQFESEDFRSYLDEQEVDSELINRIIDRMTTLNQEIRSDKTNLGTGFEIGHSFFCPGDLQAASGEGGLGIEWYRSVIREEIAPLLSEYWFDDPTKVETLVAKLLS